MDSQFARSTIYEVDGYGLAHKLRGRSVDRDRSQYLYVYIFILLLNSIWRFDRPSTSQISRALKKKAVSQA